MAKDIPHDYFNIDKVQKLNNHKINICNACYNINDDYILNEMTQRTNESLKGLDERKELSRLGSTFKIGIQSMADVSFRVAPETNDDELDDREKILIDHFAPDLTLQAFAKELYTKGLLENGGYLLNFKSSNSDNKKTTTADVIREGITCYTEFISRTRTIDKFTKRDFAGNITRLAILGERIADASEAEDPFKISKHKEVRVYTINKNVCSIDGDCQIGKDSCEIRVFVQEKEEWSEDKEQAVILDHNPIVEYKYNTSLGHAPFWGEAKLQTLEMQDFGRQGMLIDKLLFPTALFHGGKAYAKAKQDELCDGSKNCNIDMSLGGGQVFTTAPLENGNRTQLLEFISPDSSNFANISNSRESKNKEIKEGFARFIQSQRSNKSAEESKNETIEAESRLQANIHDVEDIILKCHKTKCYILGIDPKLEVKFNTKLIEEGMTELLHTILSELNVNEVISDKIMIEELESHGVFKKNTADMILEDKQLANA